jgi:hypothetical protein
MLRKLTVLALTVLLSVGLLLAHGNATHLIGSVTAIGKDTVTIQDKDGKSVVVTVEKATKYFKNKKPAAADEMKVGMRVVIDAQMDPKTKMYSAEEIQLGTTPTATAITKPAPAPKK